ncbi:YfhO family protein [Symmachiella dynata]|uniref:YfhO family protein n=1 Tax=Symmachiella dynata TaxID=2527995 RepID=UPI0030EE4917
MHKNSAPESSEVRSLFYVTLTAVALTVLFWLPLWEGGGLIGGDTYSYFFPQKTFFADSIAAGELAAWNNRTGFGYPAIAESQTGVLYPPNHVFYRIFEANGAYVANQILHYVLTFIFTWLYARSIGLRALAAVLVALVYTYGWFPPRMCLEWAIIGGTWLPASLWAAESFLQSRRWLWLFVLSLTLALSMLAGHFNLAFITQLVLLAYIPLRLWFTAASLPQETRVLRSRCATGLLTAMVLGFSLAAIQLAPTWELRGRSQRSASANTGYGHMPVWYWSQVVMPWKWYRADVDLDRVLNENLPPGSAMTNKVEAHLYFGLAPLIVVLAGIVFLRRKLFSRHIIFWIGLGIAALLYTPGWLLPVTQYLPGFSFFMGPGRYGIVVTLAFALLAGTALDAISQRMNLLGRWLLVAVVFAATTADLWYVSRAVTNVVMLSDAPLRHVDESPVAQKLAEFTAPTRLYAPGANLTNILGTASYPVYLGLGPAQYFDESLSLPAPFPLDAPPPADQLAAVQQAGVTHILSGQSLESLGWPMRLLWYGVDPFLHRAWARSPNDPLFLYELSETRGRAYWESPSPEATVEIETYRPSHIVIRAASQDGGMLVLTDLEYPGWQVDIDGKPAAATTAAGLYRGVEVPPGTHMVTWNYHPVSLYWGAAITVATLLLWAIVGHLRYWHPGRLNYFEKQGETS